MYVIRLAYLLELDIYSCSPLSGIRPIRYPVGILTCGEARPRAFLRHVTDRTFGLNYRLHDLSFSNGGNTQRARKSKYV